MYRTNEDVARQVYRALKTPTDNNPRTDPILAFHFKGKDDYIMMRCNKSPEISIKGKGQTAGEVKFFAYSDFSEYREDDVLFRLRAEVSLIELYRKGAIEAQSFRSWDEFTRWLDDLDENLARRGLPAEGRPEQEQLGFVLRPRDRDRAGLQRRPGRRRRSADPQGSQGAAEARQVSVIPVARGSLAGAGPSAEEICLLQAGWHFMGLDGGACLTPADQAPGLRGGRAPGHRRA